MDLPVIIKAIGLFGLFVVIFAESGLLIGFFLPGDSVLFTAGFLASQGYFSLPVLCITFAVAAILGDSVGYSFGRRVGRKLFQREDSTFFKKKYLERAEAFYEKHGAKTIVIARFMPVVRTFAPIVAGISDMHYRRFVTYNIAGGLIWGVGVTVAGYVLGAAIPDVDKYLLPIIILIIVVSILPSGIHIWRDQEMRAAILSMPRNLMNRSKQPATTLEADKTE